MDSSRKPLAKVEGRRRLPRSGLTIAWRGSLQRERGAAFDPTTRVTTGVPGLDELVNGGYFVAALPVVPFAGYLGLVSRSPERRMSEGVPETP